MIMGLHRDPGDCKDFSIFERELRRKLWFSIVELDLQISLASGMPTTIRSSDFNCRLPINVDDSDVAEDTLKEPEYRDVSHWTNALTQLALSYSIRLPLDAANLSSTLNLDSTRNSILNIVTQLENRIPQIPPLLRPGQIPSRILTQVLLDIYLRRSLIYLYCPLMVSPLCTLAIRTAALNHIRIVQSHLDAFDPSVADPNLPPEQWDLFHVVCKTDILRSAFMSCYEIGTLNFSRQGGRENWKQEKGEGEISWSRHSLTRIVENTLSGLIKRLGSFGNDLKDVLPLSVVLQSVRTSGSGEEKRELMKKGAKRVLEACRKAVPLLPETQVRLLPLLPCLQNH